MQKFKDNDSNPFNSNHKWFSINLNIADRLDEPGPLFNGRIFKPYYAIINRK